MEMKDVVNKTQNDKIKRMQMMARIKYIIGDEIKSKQMIQYTNKLKQDKKQERQNGKDYLTENVEKASVWPEIQQKNL